MNFFYFDQSLFFFIFQIICTQKLHEVSLIYQMSLFLPSQKGKHADRNQTVTTELNCRSEGQKNFIKGIPVCSDLTKMLMLSVSEALTNYHRNPVYAEATKQLLQLRRETGRVVIRTFVLTQNHETKS